MLPGVALWPIMDRTLGLKSRDCGFNPGSGEVVVAVSLFDCTGIILNHKEKGKLNPSIAICEANTDIRAMNGKKMLALKGVFVVADFPID